METEEKQSQIEQTQRFNQLRKAVGLSADEFAQKLGFEGKIYIYNINGKKQGVPKTVLERLAITEFTQGKVNLNWLLMGIGEMFQASRNEGYPGIDTAFRLMAREFDNLVIGLRRHEEEIAALRAEVDELKKKR